MATCPAPSARLRAPRRAERVRKLRNQSLRRLQQRQVPDTRDPQALPPRRAIPSQQLKARRPPRPNRRLPLRRRQRVPNRIKGPRAPRTSSAARPRRCRPAALTAASGSRDRPTASSLALRDSCVAECCLSDIRECPRIARAIRVTPTRSGACGQKAWRSAVPPCLPPSWGQGDEESQRGSGARPVALPR